MTFAGLDTELSFFQVICYARGSRVSHGSGFAIGPTKSSSAYPLDSRNFMNADLRRRTNEVVSRLTQLRDSL